MGPQGIRIICRNLLGQWDISRCLLGDLYQGPSKNQQGVYKLFKNAREEGLILEDLRAVQEAGRIIKAFNELPDCDSEDAGGGGVKSSQVKLYQLFMSNFNLTLGSSYYCIYKRERERAGALNDYENRTVCHVSWCVKMRMTYIHMCIPMWYCMMLHLFCQGQLLFSSCQKQVVKVDTW